METESLLNLSDGDVAALLSSDEPHGEANWRMRMQQKPAGFVAIVARSSLQLTHRQEPLY